MNGKLPLNEFLRTNFPDLMEAWKLSEEEWSRLFSWHIGTGNIFTFQRGVEILGFFVFRPMTKEQLKNRRSSFEWDPTGEYLYVPLLVVKKSWKGRGMWNLMKGLAAYTYPSIKFIAYESFKDLRQDLNIIPAPNSFEERKRKDGKRKVRSRTSTNNNSTT